MSQHSYSAKDVVPENTHASARDSLDGNIQPDQSRSFYHTSAQHQQVLLGLGSPGQLVCVVLMFVVAGILVFTLNSYYVYVLATIAATALVGIGLNVLLGLTGQVSFGHIGFYAIGAYVVAILTTTYNINFWLAWCAAAVVTGVLGALLA